MFREYFYQLATDQINTAIASVLKAVLLLFSYLYRTGISLRMKLYEAGILKKKALTAPVISVGNITWGGTGKTPLVMFIVRLIKSMDKDCVVLSRGYKKTKEAEGDEVKMIKDVLDVDIAIGADRFKSATNYLKHNDTDFFVLDDGFQHIQLKRNLNILVVDSMNPFGNGQLIPRGILREPLNALKRADLIVLSKVNWCNEGKIHELKRVIKEHSIQPILEAVHKPVFLLNLNNQLTIAVKNLNNRPVCAVSAIGAPLSFEKSLSECGALVKKHFTFKDHHAYAIDEIAGINQYCQKNNIKTVVTTAKDAVKLKALLKYFDQRLEVLSLTIEVELVKGKELLVARITHLLSR